METSSSADALADCAILLVEDDAIAALDMRDVLETAGARVIGPAYSLGQGFHFLETESIDCALLDINLNCLLVFELADALTERNVPIVFMSADTLDTAPPQHRARKLVRKPLRTSSLVGVIRDAITGKRPVAQMPSGTAFDLVI